MQRGAEQLILRRLTLLALLITLCPLIAAAQSLRETSNVKWKLPEDWFGGFSAIELDPSGTQMTVLSDRGAVAQARITRDDGRITAIALIRHARLRHRNNNRMLGISADAEGLALAPDGQLYLSFEQRHRIARLDPETGRTVNIARFAENPPFHENNGFEALAIQPDGTFFMIPEKLKKTGKTLPVYQLQGTTWQKRFDLPRADPFLPVGADFDSDGTLYLLERAITPLGFRSQIRRVAFRAEQVETETLWHTGPGQYGNLEGISLWHDPQGRIRLTTISDDNFAPILFTQVVEFILTE